MEERLLWTPGMLKSAHPLENELKVVDYQRGQLKCTRAFSGELSRDRVTLSGMTTTEKRIYAHWLHPDVPLGFAEARIELERTARHTTIYRLQDFGTNAKSELPESN